MVNGLSVKLFSERVLDLFYYSKLHGIGSRGGEPGPSDWFTGPWHVGVSWTVRSNPDGSDIKQMNQYVFSILGPRCRIGWLWFNEMNGYQISNLDCDCRSCDER
jgi:hypothetical protein